jgi:murein DD-endopeptidase MepM/ murein hydrolase activator NlpD
MSFRLQQFSADGHQDPEEHHAGHERRHIRNPTHPHHEHRTASERQRVDHPAEARPRTGNRRPPARPFTFGHGDRLVRLGPVAFWTVVGALVIMAGWSAVTATYFAFQDDVLTRMVARQAAMQFAYEDRLAEMRARVDRVTSRQMLDQEQLEQKLEQLMRRQAVLEQRATSLGAVADPSTTGSTRSRAPASQTTPKASPISAPAGFTLQSFHESRAEEPPAPRPRIGNIGAALTKLSESLDRVEGRQSNTLAAMGEGYDAKVRRLRAVLADIGLNHGKFANASVGGPFVPYRVAANAGPFDKQVYRLTVARAEVDHLNATINAVPLRKPVEGEIETSSSFGVRVDPFLGKPAMHTGIDFRGENGEGIRVTAAGTVVSAGWSGGYGRMVEVDHGNGLSTRYGHLSEIDVHVGQVLKTGQVVGRMGSTGRSTGPHLHYETRIDGEAVDPQRFLRAGTRLGL